MALTASQQAFLEGHRIGVFGTGRRDGSPQLSTIFYRVEDGAIVFSVTHDRAKWLNAKRQPKVALLVPEGRSQLVVYGTAECIAADPERVAITRRLREGGANPPPPGISDEEYAKVLDEQKRVVIRIVPERAFSNE